MLDLSPLQSAISALVRAWSVTGDPRRWQQFDVENQEALKAGVIQTFEVADEQGRKRMRRWLSANPVAGDVDRWMDFPAARNRTSHTCTGWSPSQYSI